MNDTEAVEYAVITDVGPYADVLFKLGEVIPLDQYGRETPCVVNAPFGRNPSKWAYAYETFADPTAAAARSAEIVQGGA